MLPIDYFDGVIGDYAEIIEKCKENGIRIPVAYAPCTFEEMITENGVVQLPEESVKESIDESIKICEEAGSRYLGSEEAEWEKTEKFIEYLAPVAKELGITICIENLYSNIGSHIIEGPCCDARKAATRIDRINEKYGAEVLGFCFDTGHANLIGLNFEDFITTLGSRLKVLHIHDNDGAADLHQIPFTFTKSRDNIASTDWEGFITGLCKIKYRGVLSFETAPVLTAFPAVMKQDVLGFIANIGKYFAGEIEIRTDRK